MGTALFWGQVWVLPLSQLGPGTAGETPESKELLLPTL